MEQMSPMLQARIAQQQEINNSNQKNNTQHVDLAQKPDTFESSTKKEDENKKGKIAKIIAIGAVVVAAIAGIVYAVKKGKIINLKDMTPDKFKQIQAEEFTGKIKGKLKNGDKVVMEYVDGVLKKSTRSGEVNFEKVYETINNEKIVKKTVNRVTTEFNITKTQKEVQSAQEKLESLLKNDKLSSDELKKQTDAIKFKSNNQKKEIESAINSKKKAEAEKIAKEKDEQEAREKAIKEAKEKTETEVKHGTEPRTPIEKNYKKPKRELTESLWQNELEESTSSNKYMLARANVLISSETSGIKKLDAYQTLIEADKQKLAFFEKHNADTSEVKKVLVEHIQQKAAYENKIQKIKDSYKGDKDLLEQIFRKVSQGKVTMEREDYRILTDLYNESFTPNSYSFIESIGWGCVDSHHSIDGFNHLVRKGNFDFDEEFAKLSPIKKDCVVYRGQIKSLFQNDNQVFELLENAKPNDVIMPDKGYAYTAFNRELANGFAGANILHDERTKYLFEIRIPKGAKVSRNLEHGGEILMPRNAEYKVISKGKDPFGIINMTLEYILPN